ncbi:MAG: 2OG-Fe(II) oxygenase [Verrucomicrobia bacterium]|nr:2OG-Fe(II) oxygenase [Verrucomicrobiota bacterium]
MSVPCVPQPKPAARRRWRIEGRECLSPASLNPNWQPGDGGELKLWTTAGQKTGAFVLIEPKMGTLVCLLSEDFWHEVVPASKTRMSITGWFQER